MPPRSRRSAKHHVLGPLGQRLFDDMNVGLTAAGTHLLRQAAYLEDYLDLLHHLARGDVDTWATVRIDGDVVALDITDVLAQIRQTAATQRSLLGDIEKHRVVSGRRGTQPPASDAPEASQGGVSVDDELKRAREARAQRDGTGDGVP